MANDSGAIVGGRGNRGHLDGHGLFCRRRRQRGTLMRYGPGFLRSSFGLPRAPTLLASRVTAHPERRPPIPTLRPSAARSSRLLGARPGAVAIPAVAMTANHDLRAAPRAEKQPGRRTNRRTPPAGALRAAGAGAHSSTELRFIAALQPGSAEGDFSAGPTSFLRASGFYAAAGKTPSGGSRAGRDPDPPGRDPHPAHFSGLEPDSGGRGTGPGRP